jgi:hypothetical protein
MNFRRFIDQVAFGSLPPGPHCTISKQQCSVSRYQGPSYNPPAVDVRQRVLLVASAAIDLIPVIFAPLQFFASLSH